MLGQELVRVFSGDAYDLTAWDKADLDLTNEKEMREKVSDLWPDIIINAVAYNAVDLCEEDASEQEKARLLNTTAPGVLADIANDLRATLVHYSTDYVFDGERPRYRGEGRAPGCCGSGCRGCSYFGKVAFDGYREHDRPNPLSYYGKTKYGGELAVEKGTDQHYILRLSKLFGKPAFADDAKRSFFDIMLEKGKNESEIQAVHDEDSAFTYALDLAQETRSLIEESVPFGIYHITNDGSATWYEAVKKLYDMKGIRTSVKPVPSSAFPRPAQRPARSRLITTKREPLRSWEEALEEYLKSNGSE